MPKKNKKSKETETKDMVLEVKAIITDIIVREWLHSPIKEWGNRSPLKVIKDGDGEKLLEAIKKAGEDAKPERESVESEGISSDERNHEEEDPCECRSLI